MLYIIKNLLFYESRFKNPAPPLFYVLRFRLLPFAYIYCYTQSRNEYFFIIILIINPLNIILWESLTKLARRDLSSQSQ